MKKILLLFFITSIFFGCASLKSVEEPINPDTEVLGTVRVSTLGFTWSRFKPEDKKTKKLISRLEKKAIKQYGENIRLINVEVGKTSPIITPIMWGGSGLVGYAAMLAAAKSATETKSDKYNPLLFVTLGTGTIFFFKGFEAVATVVKSDVPYERCSLVVHTKDELKQIEQKRILAEQQAEKERKEAEQQAEEERREAERRQAEEQKIAERKAMEERQENAKKIKDGVKKRLVERAKKHGSPLAFTYKAIYDINSIDGVSIQINYINTSDKIIKYIYLDLVPYNRVNDALPELEKTVTATNFVYPIDIIIQSRWECVWYNSTLSYFKIKKIRVVFDDNTSVTVDDAAVIADIEFTAEEAKLYSNPLNENLML